MHDERCLLISGVIRASDPQEARYNLDVVCRDKGLADRSAHFEFCDLAATKVGPTSLVVITTKL
jgi:hypothetical protein